MAVQNNMILSAYYCNGQTIKTTHHHNEYEILFITKGSVYLKVGSKEYSAGENDLILLTNLESHSIHPKSEEYERFCISLSVISTDSEIQNPVLLNLLKNHTGKFRHCLSMEPYKNALATCFQQLLSIDSNLFYSNKLSACIISEILYYVLEAHPGLLSFSGNENSRRILNVQKYIDKHYAEKLRISDICKEFYISNTYLTHQFTALVGYSPKRYLIKVRLKHTANLLLSSQDSIQNILSVCGFEDINNFEKQFKKEFLLSPLAYRKQYQ